MRFAFHALDVGPGQNHALVITEAALRNHVVTCHLGGALGRVDPLAGDPEVLVTSISSAKNEEEIGLGLRAHQRGTPWLVLTDTHEAWRRPAAKEHTAKVNRVLVAHSDEVTLAEREWGYPRAEFLGYPPRWGLFLRTLPSREYVRAQITKRRAGVVDLSAGAPHYSIEPGDALALVGGVKSAELTNLMLAAVITAGRELYGERLVVAPRFHPREDPPKDPEERARILEGVWCAETEVFPLMDPLLAGVDLTVTTGGATVLIYAALLRKPVVYYREVLTAERMEAQVGKIGWFPVDRGAAYVANGQKALVDGIRELATPEGALALTEAQRMLYPDDAVKAAVSVPTEWRIVDFLEREFVKT